MTRVYKRKFDWDEAAKLRREGWKLRELAAKYSVSESAVYLATDARARARNRLTTWEWQRGGTCVDCGCRISRNPSRPVKRCRACYALARPTTVRPTTVRPTTVRPTTVRPTTVRPTTVRPTTVRPATLRCFRCKQWKPDNEYPCTRAASSDVRRGRHRECRACNTAARRAYREARKVPCANGCGKLVLAPNEQAASARHHGYVATGMCRRCANQTRMARRNERGPT